MIIAQCLLLRSMNYGQKSATPSFPAFADLALGPAMLISILHRVTGNALAIAGGLLFTAWLVSLSMGAETYQMVKELLTSPVGYFVLIGLSWSFFQHMLSGLRHFVLDTGAGYEVESNNKWSSVISLLSILMTSLFWGYVFFV